MEIKFLIFALFASGIFCGFVFTYIYYECKKKTYFNVITDWNESLGSYVGCLEFRITDITLCGDKKGNRYAKYTLLNGFFKDIDKFVDNTFYMYDEVGKYNVGDVLKLAKFQKTNI